MKKLTKVGKQISRFFRKNGPVLLAVVSVVGVPVTAYLTAKAVPKSESNKKQATTEKGEELTPVETVVATIPSYMPAVAAGGATIACICFGTMLSRKQQAAIAGAYLTVANSYSDYKKKVAQLYGEGSDEQIREAILNDECQKEGYPKPPEGEKLLFWEEIRGEFFERTMEEVLLAEYHLNRNFILAGSVTLNEFYEFLELMPIKIGDVLGWSYDAGFCMYGYQWIDFVHRKVELDDGLECYIIDMPFVPTGDF